MSFSFRFYFTDQRKFLLGLLLLLSLICFCYPLSLQLHTGFSFLYFSVAFIFMNISFFILFQFLKTILSPALQVFPDQVIVSVWRREVISLREVKSLQIKSSEVEIHYLRNGLVRSKKFKVNQHPFQSFVIRDGKIQA